MGTREHGERGKQGRGKDWKIKGEINETEGKCFDVKLYSEVNETEVSCNFAPPDSLPERLKGNKRIDNFLSGPIEFADN